MVQTQLRITVGMSGAIVTGLDYAGARAILETFGLWDEETIDGLQAIESVAISEMNAKAVKDG